MVGVVEGTGRPTVSPAHGVTTQQSALQLILVNVATLAYIASRSTQVARRSRRDMPSNKTPSMQVCDGQLLDMHLHEPVQ